MKKFYCLAILLIATTIFAAEAPNAVTVSATELKAQPDAKAAALLSVPAQSNVSVGERQGAWYKAMFNGKSGWLKLLSVKLLGDKAATQKSGLADLAAATKGTKSNVGTGIRGLTTQKLEKAEENMVEVNKLENYAIDKEEALAFAKSGNIVMTKTNSDKE